MRSRLLARCAAILLTGATTQAQGADAADPTQAAIDALKLQKELVDAQTGLTTAQTGKLNAQIAALGLSSGATGKTELGEKAGQIEGWMLASAALAKAATTIASDAAERAGASPSVTATVVLLAGAETFRLDLPATIDQEMTLLADGLRRAGTAASCTGRRTPSTMETMEFEMTAAAVPGALPLIGAALGALKTDTTITGFDVAADARLMINTIAGTSVPARPVRWIIPSELVSTPEGEPLAIKWEALRKAQLVAVQCRAALQDTPKDKAAAVTLDRVTAAVDAFAGRVTEAKDGASLLAQAVAADAIRRRTPAPLVLRIFMEKAGGSTLKRQNLWTMLGAPAVGLTGGAVVSWRLSDPRSGQAMGGKTLVCRTALTNLRAIHRGRTGASDCTPAPVSPSSRS